MLEAFRNHPSERGAKFVAPAASRPHRTILGNIEGSITRSESSDSIYCPQPLRRPNSPTQPPKRRSKRNLLTEEREREACQEIQQILGARQTPGLVRDAVSPGGTPSLIVPSASYSAFLTGTDVSNRNQPESSEPDLGHLLIRPSVPVARNLMFGTPSIEGNEYVVHANSEPSGVNDSASNVQLHDDLTASHDSLGASDLGITHNALRVSFGELYEPSVTPPMRSDNPVALNSPFFYDTESSGAEIGLLSFSPPSHDSLMQLVADRRARLPPSTASEYTTRKRFGDAAPRRGRALSILYGNTAGPSTVDTSGQQRARISHANEVF